MHTDRGIRLMIVDRHPLVRWALSHLVNSAADVTTVAEANDAPEALAAAASTRPDVAVIDCALGDGEGWALAHELRDRYEDLGIVILTAEGSDDVLFRALDSGASSYVSKLAPLEEVVAAIRHAAVAAGSFSATGLADALRRRYTAPQASERVMLSAREQQVLDLLQAGLSVPAVAANLYVSVSTAKTYVARLYQKLGACNRAQALMSAVRLGLCNPKPEPVAVG
jgi:DNA-binding NarL/FixJ family response regulator